MQPKKKEKKKNEENKRKQEKHVERRGELTFYPLVSSAGNFPMPVAKFLAGLRMFHGQVNRRTESQSSRSSDLAKLKEDKKKKYGRPEWKPSLSCVCGNMQHATSMQQAASNHHWSSSSKPASNELLFLDKILSTYYTSHQSSRHFPSQPIPARHPSSSGLSSLTLAKFWDLGSGHIPLSSELLTLFYPS